MREEKKLFDGWTAKHDYDNVWSLYRNGDWLIRHHAAARVFEQESDLIDDLAEATSEFEDLEFEQNKKKSSQCE